VKSNYPKKMILTAGPSITGLEKKYVNDAVSNGWNSNWNNYLVALEKELKFFFKSIIFFSNSKNLYKRSEDTFFKLFKDNALKIIDGKVKAKKQKGKSITFFKKDLLKYDKLILNKKYRLDKLIKISNARSFGEKIFNYFYYKNQKYSFNIKIKKNNWWIIKRNPKN